MQVGDIQEIFIEKVSTISTLHCYSQLFSMKECVDHGPLSIQELEVLFHVRFLLIYLVGLTDFLWEQMLACANMEKSPVCGHRMELLLTARPTFPVRFAPHDMF